MVTDSTQDDNGMPVEIDFTNAVRGKFYRPNLVLRLPIYLDQDVQDFFMKLAAKKCVAVSDIINDLLKKDIALLDVLR